VQNVVTKQRKPAHPCANYDAEQRIGQVDLQAQVLHPARQIETNKIRAT
jgi:hypothetical protein